MMKPILTLPLSSLDLDSDNLYMNSYGYSTTTGSEGSEGTMKKCIAMYA